MPPFLKLIFESCMKQAVFPEIWKQADLVPSHKKNSKHLKQNYRPISLLSIFGKILEKLMLNANPTLDARSVHLDISKPSTGNGIRVFYINKFDVAFLVN